MRLCKLLVLFVIPMIMLGCATEINKVRLYEAPKPDDRILRVVSQVMQEYLNGLEFKEDCVLEMDTNGILQTNWHPIGKGEEKRKIQIYVWGTIYRIDVWQKSIFHPFKGSKDYDSRLVEMNLQFLIEEKLRQT